MPVADEQWREQEILVGRRRRRRRLQENAETEGTGRFDWLYGGWHQPKPQADDMLVRLGLVFLVSGATHAHKATEADHTQTEKDVCRRHLVQRPEGVLDVRLRRVGRVRDVHVPRRAQDPSSPPNATRRRCVTGWSMVMSRAMGVGLNWLEGWRGIVIFGPQTPRDLLQKNDYNIILIVCISAENWKLTYEL